MASCQEFYVLSLPLELQATLLTQKPNTSKLISSLIPVLVLHREIVFVQYFNLYLHMYCTVEEEHSNRLIYVTESFAVDAIIYCVLIAIPTWSTCSTVNQVRRIRR